MTRVKQVYFHALGRHQTDSRESMLRFVFHTSEGLIAVCFERQHQSFGVFIPGHGDRQVHVAREAHLAPNRNR